MPMTRFAAMGRSDHSMRPPTPATTLAYKSPNACNLCHADHPAAWADQWVRKWYGADYQAPVLRRAQLLDAARKQQWQRLPEMLAAMSQGDDAVYKASLVRLLRGCNDPRKQPVLLESLHDASPLVRSSAVSTLGDQLTPEVAKALLVATADPSRLVRIRSAMALAGAGADWPPDERQRRQLARATDDFLAAMKARPDDWASYANLGNFHMQRGDFAAAAASFETASKLEPRVLGPHVNAAIAYSNLRQTDKAEAALRRALAIEPANAAANFNLGLLLAEQSRLPEAEQALRAAWKADPQMAPAAYNLGVLLAERDVAEAVAWCRKAYQLGPHETKYAHTLAFYLRQKGDTQEAVGVLREVLAKEPSDWEGYLLLGELHQQRHEAAAAAAIYRVALKKGELPGEVRRELETRLRKIEMP